jgi:hypothetical protein
MYRTSWEADMEMNWTSINWLAILTCVVIGQVFLTLWFAVVFAKPWAKAYGVDDPKEHTKQVPGYTYAIGALCVLLMSLGTALLQSSLEVDSAGEGLVLGLFLAIHFGIAMSLPGYAFLRRYSAFALALGSQTVLIVIVSTLLSVWRA